MSCPTPPGEIPAAQPDAVRFDSSKAPAIYANVCRVTGTAEEIVMDFGLFDGADSQAALDVRHRVALNHFTAKRLLAALAQALERHEAAFGSVETSVEKRAAQATG
jgi:hypothetical protein